MQAGTGKKKRVKRMPGKRNEARPRKRTPPDPKRGIKSQSQESEKTPPAQELVKKRTKGPCRTLKNNDARRQEKPENQFTTARKEGAPCPMKTKMPKSQDKDPLSPQKKRVNTTTLRLNPRRVSWERKDKKKKWESTANDGVHHECKSDKTPPPSGRD